MNRVLIIALIVSAALAGTFRLGSSYGTYKAQARYEVLRREMELQLDLAANRFNKQAAEMAAARRERAAELESIRDEARSDAAAGSESLGADSLRRINRRIPPSKPASP